MIINLTSIIVAITRQAVVVNAIMNITNTSRQHISVEI